VETIVVLDVKEGTNIGMDSFVILVIIRFISGALPE